MPEQSHPPYVSGAVTIPRQLERWLDVNPQNGPLKRTETYISVPAFSINHVWRGYSEIVGEYHLSSPNNFSFKLVHDGDVIPTDTNYTLCVSYVNDDNTVVRYSLVRSSDDLFYFNVPEYAGQLIKKNFRIEIWNAVDTSPAQSTDVVLYTSVLGNQDYRFGTDSPLTSTTTLCQGQQTTSTETLSPIGTNQELWLDGGTTWSNHLWTDRSASLIFTSDTDLSTQSDVNLVTLGGSIYIGDVANAVSSWMYFITRDIFATVLMHFDNGAGVTGEVGVDINGHLYVSVSTGGTSTGTHVLAQNHPYIMYFEQEGTCNVYDAVTLLLVESIGHDAIQLQVPDVAYRIGLGATTFDLRAVLSYNDFSLDPFYTNSIFPYMQALPSGGVAMTLPFVWDVCGTGPAPFNNGATIGIG